MLFNLPICVDKTFRFSVQWQKGAPIHPLTLLYVNSLSLDKFEPSIGRGKVVREIDMKEIGKVVQRDATGISIPLNIACTTLFSQDLHFD